MNKLNIIPPKIINKSKTVDELQDIYNTLNERLKLYGKKPQSKTYSLISEAINLCLGLIDIMQSETISDIKLNIYKTFTNRDIKNILLCIRKSQNEETKTIIQLRNKYKNILLHAIKEIKYVEEKLNSESNSSTDNQITEILSTNENYLLCFNNITI